MAKSCFLGLKRVPKVVFSLEEISAKLIKKWPKYGKKLFSRPKKGQNVQKEILSQNFFLAKSVKKFLQCTHAHTQTHTHTGFYLKF